MATYQAVAVTGQAILGLLANACPKPEFAGALFELYQPGNFLLPMEEGISLYLYRITVNVNCRNLPPRLGPHGQRTRPPLPLDLYYMLTPWAKSAAKQQRLLGWAMRTLEDTPILPSGFLNHYGPETETFRPDETVELICEPISLQDMINIWDVFKPHQQLSVTYVARMIAIESPDELTEAELVQTRMTRISDFGKVSANK
jgi:hypothetical protein